VQELVDAEEESKDIDAVAEDVQSPQEHPEAGAKNFHYVSDADDQEFQRQEERRYSQREQRPTVYPDYVLYHTMCDVNDVNEPVTLKEALSSVSGKNWEIAVKMELGI
jgi:hypothetical protein